MSPNSIKLLSTIIGVSIILGLLVIRIFAKSLFDYFVCGALLLLTLLMIWHSHI